MSKSQDVCYAAWATAWGPMGGVMGAAGLRRIVLPHYQMDDLLALLAWEHKGAVRDETPFDPLIALTRDYFNGKAVDFAAIACELPAEGSFSGKVLRAVRSIPYGQTQTYAALAKQITAPDSARAVGTAVGKNPVPLVIPCHRVVRVGGGLGGFSAPGGTDVKQRMLALERAGLQTRDKQ